MSYLPQYIGSQINDLRKKTFKAMAGNSSHSKNRNLFFIIPSIIRNKLEHLISNCKKEKKKKSGGFESAYSEYFICAPYIRSTLSILIQI